MLEILNTTTIIGVCGATIILIAFILNELNKLSSNDFIYDFLNFVGSLLLVIYAYLLWSIPFFVLNMVWCLVSFRDILSKKNERKT